MNIERVNEFVTWPSRFIKPNTEDTSLHITGRPSCFKVRTERKTMTRESYRVWIPSEKKMYYPEEPQIIHTRFYLTPAGVLVEPYCCGEQMMESEGILMLGTGLIDQAGKDIYDGDIVAVREETFRDDYGYYVVEYDAKKAAFVIRTHNYEICRKQLASAWYHFDTVGLSFTVAGNKYENRDLLRKTQTKGE